MGDVDPNISNGSCWANVNVALEEAYIPCGNAADGNSYACCRYGDNCLSSNACYHGRFSITYLAGCTSQDFRGPACQNKGDFYNQSWVGLQRCDPDQFSWAGCPEKDEVVGTSPPSANCICSPDKVLFQDGPMLENIASLPQSLGGTISWYPNHKPTAITASKMSPQATLSTTTTGASSSDLAQPSQTISTANSTAPTSSRLSIGQEAGMGVGIGLGVVIVVSLVVAIAMFLHKKRKSKAEDNPQATPSPSSPPTVQEDPPRQPSPPYIGYKAELPADEPLSASTMATTSMPSTPTSSLYPGKRQYKAYNPRIHGSYSERSSTFSQLPSPIFGQGHSPASSPASLHTPQRTGQPLGSTIESGNSVVEQASSTSVHELEG
ncbi:hypothetical protein F5Y19DRAFT_489283 [Xylariaceae sp. FL1651]|nr:hypothetical protein F5Y19DRAFT_489283 [Xylariaceae sp. FL1651]